MRGLGSFRLHVGEAPPILMDRRPARAQHFPEFGAYYFDDGITVIGKFYEALKSRRGHTKCIGSVFGRCKSPFESNFHHSKYYIRLATISTS